MGVLKPNTDNMPTGVVTSCEIVLLGVGVMATTTCLPADPPNVARKLATKRLKSSGATYTWVESYCGPTATFAVAAQVIFGAAQGSRDRGIIPQLSKTAEAIVRNLAKTRIGFFSL